MEMAIGSESKLVCLCIEAACQSRESIENWRRQKRTLERLPSQLADALFRCLHRRRLLFPSLLEVFKHTVEEIDLSGENSVDAEWMAYVGAFQYLRSLSVSDCHRITSSALWAITGMANLRELDLSRCMKVTDAGVSHLISISTLEKLHISETGLSTNGVILLSSLKNLSVLNLGGLPVTDQALNHLLVLTKLQYLDIWGSKISDEGAVLLPMFPKLSFLNLAWTNVTKLPNISSLKCLNLSNCTINSILYGDGNKVPLATFSLSGTTFINEAEAFLYIEASNLTFLDVSHSSLHAFSFLAHMKVLEHLDLSSSMMVDDLVELIACVGGKLKSLNLSNTRVSSAGVAILAGHVSNLEVLSLSHTLIDDAAISYISLMPSIRDIDLSNTNIKGFIRQVGADPDLVPSLTALQSLKLLKRLNLEHTHLNDAALCPISSFQSLTHFSLRSASLTDVSLDYMSSLPQLTNLSIRDAVLTNYGLHSFKPPSTLQVLDFRGCWLLTGDAVSLFCKTHLQIEVRHELVRLSRSDHNNSSSPSPSPSRVGLKTTNLNQWQGTISMSNSFLDQRLKYSREELLAMQFSNLSLAFHNGDFGTTQDAVRLD